MDNVAGRAGRLWYKYRLIVVALLLFVVGLAVVLWHLGGDKKPSAVDTAMKQAQADTTKGDYNNAYNKLKGVEGQAISKQDKVALYAQLAAAAGNADKLDDAIGYLQKRHQLDASTVGPDAELLGGYYERKGDTAGALAQYKLGLTYYESLSQQDIGIRVTVSGLKERIAELEGSHQ